jgi:hypothetical protein
VVPAVAYGPDLFQMKQTREHVQENLIEQLAILWASEGALDRGFVGEARPLAVTLRALRTDR